MKGILFKYSPVFPRFKTKVPSVVSTDSLTVVFMSLVINLKTQSCVVLNQKVHKVLGDSESQNQSGNSAFLFQYRQHRNLFYTHKQLQKIGHTAVQT